MSQYHGFARVYDLFTRDTPVGEWIAFIERLWANFCLKPDLVLDIGCGTGSISLPLAQKGYGVIGIDISEDMLSFARQKAEDLNLDILFLRQDMRALNLYGTVDSIVCICDVINYLQGNDELRQVFELAYKFLNCGGLFIFDVSTEYKFMEILSDNNFCDINDNAAYIWENSYNPETHINEYLVTFFVENNSGQYERFEECHSLRAFSTAEITYALQTSGFSVIETYDACGFGQPSYECERIFFCALKI